MSRPRTILVARIALCFTALGGICLGATQPNVVLIVADDLGYGDLSCYGSQHNQTPNIDGLAERGVRFTDFHSAGSMCSPTRAAMLTGHYQQRFGRKFDGPLSGERHRDTGLPHEALTIAEVLKQAGYVTACFGKWHLGYQPPWLPPNHGFDHFRGLGSGDGDHHSHIDRSGNEDWWHNDEIKMEHGYTADLLTKYSVDFIQQHRDRPFFLYVPHLGIHFPWQGPDDPAHRVQGQSYHDDKWGIIPDRSNVRPHIKSMVESIDQSTGAIVDALRRYSLESKTLVLFTSDNGGYLTYGERFQNISSNGALRGQKGTLYEGGHRVPAIFCWPGTIAPAVTSATGHSTDLFVTLAAFAGLPTQQWTLDGVDLSGLLLRADPLPKRMLFWREGSELAVRSGPWKLVVEGGVRQLFHLGHDVGERTNLLGRHPLVAEPLFQAWQAWEADVDQSAADLQASPRSYK